MYKNGWIPFKDRSKETNDAHDQIVQSMPKFNIMGDTSENDNTKKIVLSQIWKHPQVVTALGFAFPRFRQLTGSCVGASGGICETTLIFIEAIQKGMEVDIKLPFWLHTYGKSRQRAGFRGQGEGSINSAYAEAAKLDGYIPFDMQNLPSYENDDGLTLSERLEYQWSDGANINSTYSQEGKKNVIKTTAQCKSLDDVRQSIQNLFPVHIACDYFISRGSIKGLNDNKAVMGTLDSNGGHATSILGFWENPDLGPIYNYQNNWNSSVYPEDLNGAPCSIWITEKEMNWIINNGEVYSYSNFEGFPAQKLPKDLFSIM